MAHTGLQRKLMSNNNKRIFAICIALVVISLITFNVYYFFIWKNVGISHYMDRYFSEKTDNILEKKIYKAAVKEFNYLNIKTVNKKSIVFVGDSLTKNFNFKELLPQMLILNRGIYYDTTWGVMNRIDENINNLNIDRLFLMIGYNDLQYRSNSEILKNYSLIMSRLKGENIYVQSILPVYPFQNDINQRIIDINKRLKELCNIQDCVYVDLHRHFRSDQKDAYLLYKDDGVHLTTYGYELWSKYILTYLWGYKN